MVTNNPPSDTGEAITLRITRSFNAPRELVWQAWTQMEHLMQWFCPTELRVESIEAELKVGGKWRSEMRSSAGDEYIHHGVYREIEPPHRLVFTHAWEKAKHEEACQTTLESVITVTLTEHNGVTEMVFEQVGFTSVESRDSHKSGWSSAFENLHQFLSSAE